MGRPVPHRFSFSTCSEEKPLRLLKRGFIQAIYPSCQTTISVKALKGTESPNPNQWLGLFLFSSITGLFMEGCCSRAL